MSTPPPTHTLHPLADGVYVWREPDGGMGRANAGAIVDDDGTTVVDALMVRSQWAPFRTAVVGLGHPVRRLVLTSSRIDHVGGSKAFERAAVLASSQNSTLLEGEMPVDAYRTFMPDFADELDDLAEVGTRQVTHLVVDAAPITPRCEVLPVTGHTEGDLIVLVPDADVCFAGDIAAFGVTPLGFQGDLAAWADVVDTLPDLAATIVPGHGPVGGEPECRDLAAYLRHCVAAAGDPAAIPPGPWDAWRDREPRDRINVERAALVAAGRDEVPPAMLRAMGVV